MSEKGNFLLDWYSSGEEFSQVTSLGELISATGDLRLFRGVSSHILRNSEGVPVLFISRSLIPEDLQLNPEITETPAVNKAKAEAVARHLSKAQLKVRRNSEEIDASEFPNVIGTLVNGESFTDLSISELLGL